MSRLSRITPAQLNDPQRIMYEAITGGKRGAGGASTGLLNKDGGLNGPFNVWLYSPTVGDALQRLGESIRFGAALPGRLRELAILVVAADWQAEYEWWAHSRIARREGLADDIIDALKEKVRPDFVNEDEVVVYEFARELLDRRHVSAERYQAALERFKEQGVVDLMVLLGYYTTVSMTLNVFEVALPEGEAKAFGGSD